MVFERKQLQEMILFSTDLSYNSMQAQMICNRLWEALNHRSKIPPEHYEDEILVLGGKDTPYAYMTYGLK